jgi:N-glycosylase/DNA lyase
MCTIFLGSKAFQATPLANKGVAYYKNPSRYSRQGTWFDTLEEHKAFLDKAEKSNKRHQKQLRIRNVLFFVGLLGVAVFIDSIIANRQINAIAKRVVEEQEASQKKQKSTNSTHPKNQISTIA